MRSTNMLDFYKTHSITPYRIQQRFRGLTGQPLVFEGESPEWTSPEHNLKDDIRKFHGRGWNETKMESRVSLRLILERINWHVIKTYGWCLRYQTVEPTGYVSTIIGPFSRSSSSRWSTPTRHGYSHFHFLPLLPFNVPDISSEGFPFPRKQPMFLDYWSDQPPGLHYHWTCSIVSIDLQAQA